MILVFKMTTVLRVAARSPPFIHLRIASLREVAAAAGEQAEPSRAGAEGRPKSAPAAAASAPSVDRAFISTCDFCSKPSFSKRTFNDSLLVSVLDFHEL